MTGCDPCPHLTELLRLRVELQRALEEKALLQHHLTSAQNLIEQQDRDRAHLHPFRQEET